MNENEHILIVDDEREICEVVREYLADEGYRVSTAPNGGEMRRILGEAPVDLVLLDVVLPGEDGLSLARWLRAEHPDLGIIMLTGRGDTIDRIVGLELGADDYLAKPFHLRELLARIRSIARRVGQASADPPATPCRQVRFAGWLLNLVARELFSPAGICSDVTRYDAMSSPISPVDRVRSPWRSRTSAATACSIWRAAARPGRSTARSTFRSGDCAANSATMRRSQSSSRHCAAAVTSLSPRSRRYTHRRPDLLVPPPPPDGPAQRPIPPTPLSTIRPLAPLVRGVIPM